MNGAILFNGTSHELPEHVLATLRSNDRLAWLQSFHPSTAEEVAVLCQMGKYRRPERLELDPDNENKQQTATQLHNLFDTTPDESLHDKLHEDGYYIVNSNLYISHTNPTSFKELAKFFSNMEAPRMVIVNGKLAKRVTTMKLMTNAS